MRSGPFGDGTVVGEGKGGPGGGLGLGRSLVDQSDEAGEEHPVALGSGSAGPIEKGMRRVGGHEHEKVGQ